MIVTIGTNTRHFQFFFKVLMNRDTKNENSQAALDQFYFNAEYFQ